MSRKQDANPMDSRAQVYDLTSQECVWAGAGLTPYRLCHNAFDCTTCAFDRKMRARMEANGTPSWRWPRDGEPALTDWRCRHMLSGYVSVKYCSHNFNCRDCEFDQMVEEEMRSQEQPVPVVELVAGFGLAPRHYYHQGHAWARREYGGQVRVGVDDFAARLLGPAQQWGLPSLGQALTRGEPCPEMKRGGHAATFMTPVSGVVVAVNHYLKARPEAANASPYGRGWLFIVQPSRPTGDLRRLAAGRQAEQWLEDEAGRLGELVQRNSGHRLAATGGRAVPDIYGNVSGLDWDELVQGFLVK